MRIYPITLRLRDKVEISLLCERTLYEVPSCRGRKDEGRRQVYDASLELTAKSWVKGSSASRASFVDQRLGNVGPASESPKL